MTPRDILLARIAYYKEQEQKATRGPWEWIKYPGDRQGFGHSGPTLVTVNGEWKPCEYFCAWTEGDPDHRGEQSRPGLHEHFHRETVITSWGYDADSVEVNNPADASLIVATRNSWPRILEAAESDMKWHKVLPGEYYYCKGCGSDPWINFADCEATARWLSILEPTPEEREKP